MKYSLFYTLALLSSCGIAQTTVAMNPNVSKVLGSSLGAYGSYSLAQQMLGKNLHAQTWNEKASMLSLTAAGTVISGHLTDMAAKQVRNHPLTASLDLVLLGGLFRYDPKVGLYGYLPVTLYLWNAQVKKDEEKTTVKTIEEQ